MHDKQVTTNVSKSMVMEEITNDLVLAVLKLCNKCSKWSRRLIPLHNLLPLITVKLINSSNVHNTSYQTCKGNNV